MTPITVATNTPGTPIPAGTNPFAIAITPVTITKPTPTPIPSPTSTPTPTPTPTTTTAPSGPLTVTAGTPVPISVTNSEAAAGTRRASGLLVGAGNQQTIGDESQMASNGLRLNGIIPSVDGTEPVATPGVIATDVTRLIATGNTGGGAQAGFTVRAVGVCLDAVAIPHTRVVMNNLVGAAGRATATCPTGTRLLGGGARMSPGTVGNLKLSAMFPTYNDAAHLNGARAAGDGEVNPDSWTAWGLINGSPSNPAFTTYAYALCTGAGVDVSALTVTVRNLQQLGPLTGTTSRRIPVACQTGGRAADLRWGVDRGHGQHRRPEHRQRDHQPLRVRHPVRLGRFRR